MRDEEERVGHKRAEAPFIYDTRWQALGSREPHVPNRTTLEYPK